MSLPEKKIQFLTTDLYHRRKLRLAHNVRWDHHRGGWGDVTEFLEQELSCDDGILTLNSVEETIVSGRVLDVPWVGFSHEVPHHTYIFPDLERLQQIDTWKASLPYCRGLWVLSSHNKKFLDSCKLPFPISSVYYPVAEPKERFLFDKFARQESRPLLFIGEYLRRVQPFYDLRSPGYQKILLEAPGFRRDRDPTDGVDPVAVLSRVPDDEYDRLLSRSIVFLNLIDAGANTTIVECIVRGTPILVNRVGGVCEYLGGDYPLYYESLEEAAEKLADLDLLASAVRYLNKSAIREPFTFPFFKRAIENTAVYRALPCAPSQRVEFKRFDLTVMICVYKRLHCLETLLERLSRQEFSHTFEIIIWNNNYEVREQLQAIVQQFMLVMQIRVIHSSDNLYCGVRLTAPTLMRSELLMICDDDVMPEPNYLQTFWDKHLQYGPRCVICARGHRFYPHSLDMDRPELVWKEKQFISFHDESVEDCKIHFFHADNCLIPRAMLLEAIGVNVDVPEFVLVDDYWLSYVFSHIMKCDIWKIRANHALQFDPSADDARIAMFQSSFVREQRVNFYVYHMRRGWPFNPIPGLCEANY